MGFLRCVRFLLILLGANLWCVSGRLCYFVQEPDPDQRGKLRWVLPLERQDLCSCSETRPGGVYMVIPKRAFQPYYTDHPIFTDNQEVIRNYFKCHGDCQAKMQAGYNSSGVYTIYPPQYTDGLRVYCKMGTHRGWIVFQRRFMNGTLNFNRSWAEYKDGFGTLTGEFWLGNKILRILTNGEDERKKWVVRMDLEDEDGTKYSHKKQPFRVSGNDYILHVGNPRNISNENHIGTENGVLRDENINASSIGNYSLHGCLTRYIRLNGDQNKGWCPAPDDKNPWLQFDLGKTVEIQGVVMRGGNKGWVKKYQVKYRCCDRDARWQSVMASPHSDKIFNGTGEKSQKVESNFYEPIKAHDIRIIPTEFDSDVPVVRVGLLGTKGDMFDKADKQPFSAYDKDSDRDEKNCASLSQQGWWYNRCRNVSRTEYSDENVGRFDQIVKVEFKIRIFP